MDRPVIVLSLGALLLVLVAWAVGELITGTLAPVMVDELDRPAMRWMAEERPRAFDPVMKATTHMGDRLVVTAVLGAALVASIVYRSLRWAGFFTAAIVGALLLSGTIKQLVDRPRPDFERLVEIGGLSFPSGHATAAAICYGAIALAAIAVRTWPRLVVALVCAAIAVAVAVSRVWVGVHYPTDVAAGLLCGSAWLALAYLAFLREGSVKPGVYPAATGRRGRVA